MSVDYSLPKPTSGSPRGTSPTESEIMADIADTIADVGTRLDVVEGGGYNRFHPGNYLSAPAYAVGSGALVLNRLTTFALVVAQDVAIDRIGLEVTTAGSAGSVVRLGIYEDVGTGYPGSLLLDAGTIDSTTSGFKEIAISQALTRGVYWLAAVAQVAAPSARVHSPVADTGSPTALTASANALNGYQEAGVSGALPATHSATVSPNGGQVPRVLVRAA